MFREGVIELLHSVPDFGIVADGASGESAVAIVSEYKPDVLILDVEMPGPGATTTIRRVLDASPNTRIVILTMHDDAHLVRGPLSAGPPPTSSRAPDAASWSQPLTPHPETTAQFYSLYRAEP